MVSNTFQIPCDEDQPECAADRGGILEHVGQQLAEHLLANGINVSIVFDDALCQIRVGVDEGIEALLEYALRRSGSHRYVDDWLQLRLIHNFERPACDV